MDRNPFRGEKYAMLYGCYSGLQTSPITRRQFLRILGLAGLSSTIASCTTRTENQLLAVPTQVSPTQATDGPPPSRQPFTKQPIPTDTVQGPQPDITPATALSTETPIPELDQAYLSVARGNDPAALVFAALAAIGGIERFVKDGDEVIIKPNICTDYYPFEYGATTNPQVVATLVQLSLGAGAKRVRVMDSPFGGTPKSAYERSGIQEAVRLVGGEMEVMNPNKFRKTSIPQGQSIQTWEIYQDVLDADVLIDVPIAKHHSLARLTLGGKNLMGVITNRGRIHADLGQRIADLTSIIKPKLTVIDAVRTLMRNGPTGGKLDDVQMTNTVIASHDIVAADAYAATLFDLNGEDIDYVREAARMGLGTINLDTVEIVEITI